MKNDMNYLNSDSNRWLVGYIFMKIHYWVFDMTPHYQNIISPEQHLTIGVSYIHEDAADDEPTVIETLWSDYGEYILMGLGGVAGILLIVCLVRCHIQNRRQKLDRMSKTVLTNEANKIMDGFRNKMDQKNMKAREKAMKKWKKKHPNRPIEDFNFNDVSQTLNDVSYNLNDSSY